MVEAGRPVWSLGLMSGTSLDGVDAALVRTDGETVSEFGRSVFVPYSTEERSVLSGAMGRWPGDGRGELEAAEEVVLRAHRNAVRRFADPAVVGFHGQTLAHDPAGGRTHQLGDGERLARETGNRVVWDFRSADMAAGGQGAPLAPFFHFACARHIGAAAPLAFLNLGGVGNLTIVDPRLTGPEEEGALLAFDTGPANALLNDFVEKRTGQPFDAEGALARSGNVRWQVLDDLAGCGYFSKSPPKSLDRNEFREAAEGVEALSDEDGAATLTAFSALCVHRALSWLPSVPARFLVSGGGRLNPAMMAMISEITGIDAVPVETAGLNGDMLEAQAFAYLAVRVLRGLPTSAPSTTGCTTPVCGGRVSG